LKTEQFVKIINPSECYFCNADLKDIKSNCPNCNFPQRGTEIEQRKFLGNRRAQYIEAVEFGEKIGRAKKVIFILGPLTGI
jgi:predicted amidophosphoribosyltransferase